MPVLLIKAIKDITTRKLRTLLVVLSIATGVFGLTAINISSDQLAQILNTTIQTSNLADITYIVGAASPGTAKLLARLPNVTDVQLRSAYFWRWNTPTSQERLLVTGLPDFDDTRIQKLILLSGRYPGEGEILLEQSDSDIMPVRIGDTITVEVPNGKHEKSYRLIVSGFSKTPSFVAASLMGFAPSYVPEKSLNHILNAKGSNEIMVKLADYTRKEDTAEKLRQSLVAGGVHVNSMIIGHPANDTERSSFDGIFAIMRVLSILGIFLSAFLIINTLSTLMAEQMRQIGSLKAVGATQERIVASYLLSVVLYGIAGSAVGFALGLIGGYSLVSYLGNLLNLDIGSLQVSLALVLTSLTIGVGTSLLAAFLPIYFGTRITVREAISTYGISANKGRTWFGVLLEALVFIPQQVLYPLRNIFRKRSRAILTLSALTVSGTAFLAVQATNYSFNLQVLNVFQVYNVDVFVLFTTPVDHHHLLNVVQGVSGVASAEPFDSVSATVNGRNVSLEGVLPKTTLYRPVMIAGRWFVPEDNTLILRFRRDLVDIGQYSTSTGDGGVIISRSLAQKQHLNPGDRIAVKLATVALNPGVTQQAGTIPTVTDDPITAHWKVLGIAVDNSSGQGSQGVVLAPLSQMQQFMQQPRSVDTQLLIKATDSSPASVQLLAQALDKQFTDHNIRASISTSQQQIERSLKQWQVVTALLYSVTVLVALAGAIGLFNTLSMSVLERRREIGILRSMGASNQRVAAVFWLEGISLGILAWLLSLVLGYPVAYGFMAILSQVLVEVPFHFPLSSIFAMFFFIILVASLSSIGPALAASRVAIAETLRYE